MNSESDIERTEDLIAHARVLRHGFENDPNRPAYHFMPPMGWMNDINGSIYWKGRYHIFYQHNPKGGQWEWIQWGHASSVDLVHWVHHPIALSPSLTGYDEKGCYSGGAFVSKEGVPTFIYYGVPKGECLADSKDDLLIHWTKHPGNPVIPQPGDGLDYGECKHVHDPCAWVVGDTYYAITNRRDTGDLGDGAHLFKSQDLASWEYVGLFYESNREWTEFDEDCAVPDFFQIGDRHMLLFCSHLQGTQYYLGRMDGELFVPEVHGRMSWAGGELGGARTLLDNNGRRIFFDWIRERRGVDAERESGWSGVMTVPRVLSLAEDGTLHIEPAPELEVLRMNHRARRDVEIGADSEVELDDVQGDCLELMVKFERSDAQAFGVEVRCSPDGIEGTAIVCEPSAGILKVDISQSTLDESISYPHYRNEPALERLPEEDRFLSAQEAPFELVAGEALELRIFVDRSVLEVFANNRQCITQRIYPTRADSLGVRLFSKGGSAKVSSVEAWDMAPSCE